TPPAPATPKPAPAVGPDDPVLSLGEVKITSRQWEQIVDSLPANYQAAARGPQKRQFGDLLARLFALSQEGKRRGLDQAPSFKVQSAFVEADLLARLTTEAITKDLKISEDDVRKCYEDHKGEFEQMHARHILIRTQGSPMPLAPGKKELSD